MVHGNPLKLVNNMSEIDTSKIDLNKPAFGSEAQKVDDIKVDTTSKSVEEVVKEEAPVESVEENKVPYSRFKKFHDEAQKYQQEAEYWRQQAETKELVRVEDNNTELPAEWLELYGDSEASQKAFKIQQKREQLLIEQAQERTLEAIRNERNQENSRVQENIKNLDSEIELLSDYIGRPLTNKEEESVLDIVDEFTPKDEDGNYAGNIIPLDKAWEIYEMRNQNSKSSRKSSRDVVASLSGNPTEGESSLAEKQEKDKNFNPLSWPDWKKLI